MHKSHELHKGGANIMVGWLRKVTTSLVNTTSYSVQSMLYLGGSGGMPPQKIFANLAYSILKFLQYF